MVGGGGFLQIRKIRTPPPLPWTVAGDIPGGHGFQVLRERVKKIREGRGVGKRGPCTDVRMTDGFGGGEDKEGGARTGSVTFG